MSNEIFNSLLRQRLDIFRSAFSTTSTELFFDSDTKRLRHAGEYGMYRESVVRDFLKFIAPRGLDISTGFVISAMEDVSTQCDVVAFDPNLTPLFQEGDCQRFFPVESIFCIGEVKSTLSKAQLAEGLNKLAKVKAIGERIPSPSIIRRMNPGPFAPARNPYDLVPSFLICLVNGNDLKHRFISPGENSYVHLQLFASFMFMLTTHKTLLYPEFSDYIGGVSGGFKREQA